jgi:hypothetical protein
MPPLINLTYKKNFFFNSLKEKGKKINKIDEYSSYNGSFLSILQIKNYLKKNNII